LLGFVSGVGETMGVLQFGIRKLPDFGAFSICDAPSHGAMVQAFTDWAEKNPQEWKNPAILGVMTALKGKLGHVTQTRCGLSHKASLGFARSFDHGRICRKTA